MQPSSLLIFLVVVGDIKWDFCSNCGYLKKKNTKQRKTKPKTTLEHFSEILVEGMTQSLSVDGVRVLLPLSSVPGAACVVLSSSRSAFPFTSLPSSPLF